MAKQYELDQVLGLIIGAAPSRIVISDPANKSERFKKLTAEPRAGIWQIACYTDKQVFHENVLLGDLEERLFELTEGHFRQINAFSAGAEHIVLISKKGICMYKVKRNGNIAEAPQPDISHNRKKRYLLEEGKPIPPLIDMGIFTAEGKVINSMQGKYRQINRFIEVIDDEVSRLGKESINVIDFGCGKSYLTFIVYYYLKEIRGLDPHVIGLDLKKDVIEKCNAAAIKYGYDGLRFETGDISGYETPFDVDMVITLHACDTATDHALYNAVKWNAQMIFSVPCCQHELNAQIKADSLSALTRYGIIKERFSALATDAVRADLLEACGYKAQILEFIDMEGTPKNLLIRAVRRGERNSWIKSRQDSEFRLSERQQAMLNEVKNLNREFSFEPTLLKLLDLR